MEGLCGGVVRRVRGARTEPGLFSVLSVCPEGTGQTRPVRRDTSAKLNKTAKKFKTSHKLDFWGRRRSRLSDLSCSTSVCMMSPSTELIKLRRLFVPGRTLLKSWLPNTEEDQIRKAVSTPASPPSRGTVIITPDTCWEFKANGVMLQERREIKDRLPVVSTAEAQTPAGQNNLEESCHSGSQTRPLAARRAN